MPKARQFVYDPNLGKQWGKPDVERLGLFVEMPYLSAKNRPKPKFVRPLRNIYCEGPKSKTGTQHGYFEQEFARIFEKEALKGRGRKPKPPKFKNVSERPFLPPTGDQLHSTPGDYFGCFSGNIEHFSNERRKKGKRQPELRNFFSAPTKVGGPGYHDIALSPYPEHKPDRYGLKLKTKEYGKNVGGPMITVHYPQPWFDLNPFKDPENMKEGPTYVRPKEKPKVMLHPGYIVPTGPPKTQGGCHDGCFNKFPEHKSDRNTKKGKPRMPESIFYPPPLTLKSYYNTSVVNQAVDNRMNHKNFATYQPVYNKYIVVD